MKIPALRSAHEKVGGLVYFGRMLDKIRLHAAGKLPPEYVENLGEKNWYFFDARCCRFLGVKYPALVKRVKRGGTDAQILRWCFQEGGKRTPEQIAIWSVFLAKRGWRDEASGGVAGEKAAAGFARRKDIVTWFDLFDAEQGRKVRGVIG
jgi:gluconokinase